MRKLSYRVFLYSPAAAGVTLENSNEYFLGELYSDNVEVNLRLQEISTISFSLPEYINGEINPRIAEVLDSYVIELWYGQIDGVFENGDFRKIRFIIYNTPQEFSDEKYLYNYTGYSLESLLEFKSIVSWEGIEIFDYFRTFTYNNNESDPKFLEVKADNSSVATTIKGVVPAQQYIELTPTTATVRPSDVYVYEVRERDDLTNKGGLISYESLTSTPWLDEDFKAGYYYLSIVNGFVTKIYVALPGNYNLYNGADLSGSDLRKFSYHLYDNPFSRFIAFGVQKREGENGEDSKFYLNLSQQQEASQPLQFAGFKFSSESNYFKNGLTIAQILLGSQETVDDEGDFTGITSDGILYKSGFTLGEIHPDLVDEYRSNLEFNNLSIYQIISEIAETFDSIAVYDSLNKTVSFYPENPSEQSPWVNNGLTLTYGSYIQSVSKDIDASKIITVGRGLGKDNYPMSLVTPDGQGVWEDYEYFLDDFYIENKTIAQLIEDGFTITADATLGLNITYPVDKIDYTSRWMKREEAEKLGAWQYTRNYFHNILSGNNNNILQDSGHNLYLNFYEDRLQAIEAEVKLTAELEKFLAKKSKYFTLKEHYKKRNANDINNGNYNINSLNNQREIYYQGRYNTTVAQITAVRLRLDNLRSLIYNKVNTLSYAFKLNKVGDFLNKTSRNIDPNLLSTFQREAVVADSLLDIDYEILLSTIEHVNENKFPIITIETNVASILGAEESYQDWNKVVVGESINLFLPQIDIDQEILLREIGINFEQDTLSFVISTVRNYNKNRLSKTFKFLRELKNSNINFNAYLYDTNNDNNNTVIDISDTVDNGVPVVIAGSEDEDGNPGTVIDDEGTNSQTVEDVDDFTETVTYTNILQSGILIYDANVLAFNRVQVGDEDPYTIEVEMSASNGFEIRKVEGDAEDGTLDITRQVYIDTNGNAIFAGQLSAATGTFSGTIEVGSPGYDQILALAGEGTAIFKASSEAEFNEIDTQKLNDLLFITGTFEIEDEEKTYEKDDIYRYELVSTEPDTFDWVVLDEDFKNKINGSIGGWVIDPENIKSKNGTMTIHSDSTNEGIEPYISIGQGNNEGYEQNGIFLGMVEEEEEITPRLSLTSDDNFLTWTGEELQLKGNLSGEISSINIFNALDPTTGVQITPSGIIGVSGAETSFELRSVDSYGSIAGWDFDNEAIYVGEKTDSGEFAPAGNITIGSDGHISANNFRIDTNGNAIFRGEITADSGTIGSYTINEYSINKNLISKATFESTSEDYGGWVLSGTWTRSDVKSYAGKHSVSRPMNTTTSSSITYTFTKPKTSNVQLRFVYQFTDHSSSFVNFFIQKNNNSPISIRTGNAFPINTWHIFDITIPHSGTDINTIRIGSSTSTIPSPTLFIDEIELFDGSSAPLDFINLSSAGLYLPDVSLDKYGIIANAGKVGPLLISNIGTTTNNIINFASNSFSGTVTSTNIVITGSEITSSSFARNAVNTFTVTYTTTATGSPPAGMSITARLYDSTTLVKQVTESISSNATNATKQFNFTGAVGTTIRLFFSAGFNSSSSNVTGSVSTGNVTLVTYNPIFDLQNTKIYDSDTLTTTTISTQNINVNGSLFTDRNELDLGALILKTNKTSGNIKIRRIQNEGSTYFLSYDLIGAIYEEESGSVTNNSTIFAYTELSNLNTILETGIYEFVWNGQYSSDITSTGLRLSIKGDFTNLLGTTLAATTQFIPRAKSNDNTDSTEIVGYMMGSITTSFGNTAGTFSVSTSVEATSTNYPFEIRGILDVTTAGALDFGFSKTTSTPGILTLSSSRVLLRRLGNT
jgi:hypothetical protein